MFHDNQLPQMNEDQTPGDLNLGLTLLLVFGYLYRNPSKVYIQEKELSLYLDTYML